MEKELEKKKRSFQMPHAYVLMLVIIVFCVILTWIMPAGNFERVVDPELGREIVVPGSFTSVESSPVGAWGFFLALYEGMIEGAGIIFFIMFASGYVFILTKTGALNALIGFLLKKLGSKDYLIIPIFMILFGVAGSTFGMYEETYGLIPAFIVIFITLGYDRLVGGAAVVVGVATGFASATLNPFTIGVASSIAGIPLVSPKLTIFRIVAFILFMTLSISYVMRYAKKIKNDPTKSYMYDLPERALDNVLSRDEVMDLEFTSQHKISLFGFALLIVVMAYTTAILGFYIGELSALFIIWMIATGIVNKMSSREIADAFVESSSNAIYACLLVGLARSISVVMTQGHIIDTAVLYLSNAVISLPSSLSAVGMLAVQNVVNFFIPAGSGQAVVMMPIMTPVADLVGLSREVAVTAFQFGDGFSNLFWPTACAMQCGIMGIGMDKWYKFITPLFGMMFILQAILMVAMVLLGI